MLTKNKQKPRILTASLWTKNQKQRKKINLIVILTHYSQPKIITSITKHVRWWIDSGIISRASAARGGNLYDDDLEHDSISNSETNRLAWNLPEDTRAMHTPNKLSWSNGGLNPLRKVTTDTLFLLYHWLVKLQE